MLGNLLNNIIAYFYKRKFLFVFLLLLQVAIFVVGALKINVNESIFSTLPSGNVFSKFSKLIDQGDLSNQLVFSLQVTHDKNEDLEKLTKSFSDSLNKYAPTFLKNVVIKRPDIEKKIYDYFYSNLPIFIDESYYKQIENKIQRDTISQNLANSQRSLLAPGGFLFKEFLLKDPLSISSAFFKGLNKENNFSKLNIEDGYLFSENKQELLITAKTNFKLSDNKKSIDLYNALTVFKSKWNAQHPKYLLDYFGTFQIGAENGIQVKKDTYLTLFITLVIILLILFVFYRKILIPFYFMLPVLFGCLFALSFIGFFKTEISGISIATGAVVFGIIIDFSFHFFTHLQHSKSISETLKEIAAPMLTGGFTTIMAFGALLFTNSIVLQDFGLFAALSITGAVLFTLTGLPIILKIFNFNYASFSGKKREIVFNIPQQYRKIFLAIITILTGVFFYFSFDIEFDGNLDNLSFHSQKLKLKEKELVGINPEIEKKIYLFAEAGSYEKANELNYILFQKVERLQKSHKIVSSFSTGKFIVPDSIAQLRLERWKAFWNIHKAPMLRQFNKSSDSLGFNSEAFNTFKKWINVKRLKTTVKKTILTDLGLQDLINRQDTQTTFITTIVVNKTNVDEVQKELTQLKGITSFNKSEVATELLSVVKDDFNFIFLISSLLVLVSLLVIYGRIEMALFTFIPMVISWIWILGIAAIFGIKFNFVNIVIATFVFGLGDDFSIFITDGLLHKYKHKKHILGSYNTAIILSALTTMVGTGVLFFAKHPAIHSVSIISVLGILCILLISLVVQPFLFDIFIQKRVDTKKTPLTLIAFLFSVFEFSYFVVGCFVIYLILGILLILPLPRKRKSCLLNYLLSYSAWSLMYSALHINKTILNKENLDLKNPSIIIANHTSFLDILMLLSLNPKIIIMVKGWVYKSVLFGPLVRYAGYIYVGNNPAEDLKTIKKRIDDGYSLVVFPEGTRSDTDAIKRFHKGAFFLAQELKLDITPILIHGVSYVLPKTEYLVKNGNINLKILPRIKANDPSWGTTFGKRTKSVSKYFKQEHSDFKSDMEKTDFLFHRVFANYVYKGPVLEWYVKIKWKLEAKNFEYYDTLLKNQINILDVGCGYGYLSYYLHYRNPNRTILGVDYDEEKTSIANNGFDKTDNLQFQYLDITTYDFEPLDAIILNDVLHYFSKEKQIQLLQKCTKSINDNGVIIIRDGITDFADRYKTTQLTEKLSTQLFSFNKKTEKFHFFSSEDIRIFAKKYNFSFEMKEHSSKTSNVLFVLKKM